MIAATAQARQRRLWRGTRRHRGHFEYGFLERVLPNAFVRTPLVSRASP
jgi:hypothetical protein